MSRAAHNTLQSNHDTTVDRNKHQRAAPLHTPIIIQPCQLWGVMPGATGPPAPDASLLLPTTLYLITVIRCRAPGPLPLPSRCCNPVAVHQFPSSPARHTTCPKRGTRPLAVGRHAWRGVKSVLPPASAAAPATTIQLPSRTPCHPTVAKRDPRPLAVGRQVWRCPQQLLQLLLHLFMQLPAILDVHPAPVPSKVVTEGAAGMG